MKTNVRLFALLAAVLCLGACEKTAKTDSRTILYTVAQSSDESRTKMDKGEAVTLHLDTWAEWMEQLERFCQMAEEGQAVTFRNPDKDPIVYLKGPADAKQTITYSTKNRDAMKRWMERMEDQGKTVTVTYDSATGTWNGTAYATAPQPPAPQGGLVTYASNNMPDVGYIMSFDTVNHLVYTTLHYTLQNITAPDYPVGIYEYSPCDEVNTPFAYWFIDMWGDTAGLYNLNNFIGSDSLHFNSIPATGTADMVRTDGWQTYLFENWGLYIVMHVTASFVEIYPTRYIGQMGVHGLERLDIVWPFGFGRFEMDRAMTENEGIFALRLDFSPFNGGDTSQNVSGFTIQGEPMIDDQFTISRPNGSEYSFFRL